MVESIQVPGTDSMLYSICLLFILIPLAIEWHQIIRARRNIPIRIHVHGTRGKTSCVRLIARLLRSSGLIVLAKTTGDAPELITPDGETHRYVRRGPARITEHVNVLLKAANCNADALVVEGMALQNETISFSEHILQATHYVVVNVRPDHAETMGNGCEGVCSTLSHALPKNGILYTSNEDTEPLIQKAINKNIPVRVIPCDSLSQSPVLATNLCRDILKKHGLTLEDSIFEKTRPYHFSWIQNSLVFDFFDYFSANDVVSTNLLLQARDDIQEPSLRVAILSTRSDRPLRTLDFLRFLNHSDLFDVLAFAGNHKGVSRLYLLFHKKGFDDKFVLFSDSPKDILDWLSGKAIEKNIRHISLTGLGNAHGAGERWRTYLETFRTSDHAH